MSGQCFETIKEAEVVDKKPKGMLYEIVFIDEMTQFNSNVEKIIANMKRRKVKDKRRFTVDDSMAPGYIPFGEGRPKRDKPICKDDLVNLAIAFHKCRTLSEFLERT